MDFARVLHTLSKLSHCSITVKKKPNIPGFPNIVNSVNSRTLSSTNYGADPEQPEEEIYRYLQFIYIFKSRPQFSPSTCFSNTYNPRDYMCSHNFVLGFD